MRTTNSRSLFLMVLISLFLTGCNPKIVHFINENAQMSKYSGYVLVNLKVNKSEMTAEGRGLINDIENHLRQQMFRRGYDEDRVNPDLILRYELISNQVTEVDQSAYSYVNPYYNNFNTRTIMQSALLVEIQDSGTRKLIWQASIDLDKYTSKRKKPDFLETAVSLLFDTYLYRANSNKPDPSLIEAE